MPQQLLGSGIPICTPDSDDSVVMQSATFGLERCLHLLISTDITSEQVRGPAAEIESLTERMVSGEEEAYREFYSLYFDRLLRYLIVLTRNEDTAREALQLTLVRVARHAKRFKSEAAFWSWLTVLARSSVVDEGRKAGRYLAFLNRFFVHANVENDALAQNTDTVLSEMLETNLPLLPEDDRALLQMKYFDRASVSEMASRLDSTEKAIESRLARARKALKHLVLAQLKHEK
jgi:RNA polymerase sigma-70 factor (ECF subfamily)